MKAWTLTLMLTLAGCAGRPVTARPATAAELGPETVVAQVAPPRARVFPDGRGVYAIVGGGPQGYRPLAAAGRVLPGTQARSGDWAWVAGRAVQGTTMPLPGTCGGGPAPVLQGDGAALHGAVYCPAQDRVYLFEWAPDAIKVREVPGDGGSPVEALWHDPDADYLLGGRWLVRIGPDGRQTLGTVPPPGGGADTRELLRRGDELLVVDGAVGRVIRMEAKRLRWRGELRFPVGRHVERMRAVAAPDHLLVVTAEREGPGCTLFGMAVPLGGEARDRLVLGSMGAGDLELVPVSGGALLVRQRGGKLVLQKLGF